MEIAPRQDAFEMEIDQLVRAVDKELPSAFEISPKKKRMKVSSRIRLRWRFWREFLGFPEARYVPKTSAPSRGADKPAN